jgi:hypothetical protein
MTDANRIPGRQDPTSYGDSRYTLNTGITVTDLAPGIQAPTLYQDEKTQVENGRQPQTNKGTDPKEYYEKELMMPV